MRGGIAAGPPLPALEATKMLDSGPALRGGLPRCAIPHPPALVRHVGGTDAGSLAASSPRPWCRELPGTSMGSTRNRKGLAPSVQLAVSRSMPRFDTLGIANGWGNRGIAAASPAAGARWARCFSIRPGKSRVGSGGEVCRRCVVAPGDASVRARDGSIRSADGGVT